MSLLCDVIVKTTTAVERGRGRDPDKRTARRGAQPPSLYDVKTTTAVERRGREGGTTEHTRALDRRTHTPRSTDSAALKLLARSSSLSTHRALAVAIAVASASAKRRTLLDGGCQIAMSSQEGAGVRW